MNNYTQHLKNKIAPLQEKLLHHSLYKKINNIDDIKVFMEHHVYAVFDFMSLLKSLQNNLTCTSVPWVPVGNADTRFLINEIVLGEESDVDMEGNRISHFELYLQAMYQAKADATKIEELVVKIKNGFEIKLAIQDLPIEASTKEFMSYTFHVIEQNQPHVSAAVFTFGREDLIPGMFISLINDINSKTPAGISIFKYYLERHIEVDGDHHSHLAIAMTELLCGNDEVKWKEAEAAVIQALNKRIGLWDGILNVLENNK